MLLPVQQVLGAALVLRLRVFVDAGLSAEDALPPHLRRVLGHHRRDLHAELWPRWQAQQAIRDSLPDGETLELGRYWWRFRVDPEPTIPSFTCISTPGERLSLPERTREALRFDGRALVPRIVLPRRFAVDLPRDEGDGGEERAP